MVAVDQTNETSKLNRSVLLLCWAMLSVYDRTAGSLKGNFVRRRNWVIGLTLASTVASVIVGIIGKTAWAVALAIISISLPIVGSYMMNDILRFTGTTSWVKYRYIAEMMRMHIYLYRMGAGPYAKGPASLMDDELIKNIGAIRQEVKWDEVIPPSVREPDVEASIIAAIKEANSSTPDDDGLSEITVENYIKWRVDRQRTWYNRKVDEDFTRLKLYVRAAQVFLLVGALLSAMAGFIDIQVVALVAITNTISTALTSWSNVSMYGKTYGLFQIASQQLADQKNVWNASVNNPGFSGNACAEIANFAQKIENILLWERKEWYDLVLQAQASSDKLILGDLTRLTQRAQEAQKQPALQLSPQIEPEVK
jgi:hypothetical protein